MPAMPRAHANGVELEYETVGDPAGRPLLLVQGLGAQLISVEDDATGEELEVIVTGWGKRPGIFPADAK